MLTQARSCCAKSQSSSCVRWFAASAAPALTRDFIHAALYEHSSGYFAQREVVYTPQIIDFSNILGKWEYQHKLSQLYKVGVVDRAL